MEQNFSFKMDYLYNVFRITLKDGTERPATEPETEMWKYIVMNEKL